MHGYPVSNYYNAVHAALIEKGADFTLVPTRASQDDAFLALSAMGKIPYLRTPEGSIAETVAILEYIEEVVDGVPLYPATAFERARARQVINIVQLYVEAPLRTLFPGVFMGGHNAQQAVASVKPLVERAMRALSQLVAPEPFLLGAQLTHADLFAFYTFDVGERVWQYSYGVSLLGSLADLPDWYATIAARPSSRIVLSHFTPAFAAYLRDKGAAWHEPEPKETTHA